jgi:acetyltransferase-like isoleucine patch superfamily enzyme
MDLTTRGIAKSREVWAHGWMRLAGVPAVGRLAMGVAAWAMPPYRSRVPLSSMHQRGYIAPSARLYHRHLHLGPHVFIGDHVLIYQADDASGPVELGRRVRLHQDIIIETGTGGSLIIGEESNIQPRCQLSAYKGTIHIGTGVSMAPYCALYPYDHGILPEMPIRKQPLRSRGGIVIGDEAWLGVGVIVLDGVRIGAGAVVGAGSVVAHDVPDGAVVQGVPARVVMLRSELASSTLSEQDGLSFPKTYVGANAWWHH